MSDDETSWKRGRREDDGASSDEDSSRKRRRANSTSSKRSTDDVVEAKAEPIAEAAFDNFIHVRGLPRDTTKAKLLEIFDSLNIVESEVYLLFDCQGQALFQVEGEADLQVAARLSGKSLGERSLSVKNASEAQVEEGKEAASKLSDAEERSVVRLSSLSSGVSEDDIRAFLGPLEVTAVYFSLRRSGERDGNCYVQCASESDAKGALAHDRKRLNRERVSMCRCTKAELWITRDSQAGIKPRKAENLREKCVLRMSGLPWEATVKQIAAFFEGFQLAEPAILILKHDDGRPTGDAMAVFLNEADAAAAKDKYDRGKLGERWIALFPATRGDLYAAPGGSAMRLADANYSGVARLRGLPYDCTPQDIQTFLDGLPIVEDGVFITCSASGRVTGEAFVLLDNEEAVNEAVKRHKKEINGRWIEVFKATKGELYCATILPDPSRRGGGEEAPSGVTMRGPSDLSEDAVREFFHGLTVQFVELNCEGLKGQHYVELPSDHLLPAMARNQMPLLSKPTEVVIGRPSTARGSRDDKRSVDRRSAAPRDRDRGRDRPAASAFPGRGAAGFRGSGGGFRGPAPGFRGGSGGGGYRGGPGAGFDSRGSARHGARDGSRGGGDRHHRSDDRHGSGGYDQDAATTAAAAAAAAAAAGWVFPGMYGGGGGVAAGGDAAYGGMPAMDGNAGAGFPFPAQFMQPPFGPGGGAFPGFHGGMGAGGGGRFEDDRGDRSRRTGNRDHHRGRSGDRDRSDHRSSSDRSRTDRRESSRRDSRASRR